MYIIESLLSLRSNKNQLNIDIEMIKKGNTMLRNNLISKYTPFIVKTVSSITNMYIDINNSDEFSIGLYAFNSAIDSYNSTRGTFIKYAELVIKSRVIDFLRKNKVSEIPFTQFEHNNDMNRILEKADYRANLGFENIESEDGIKNFQKNLLDFNLTLDELIELTPKHQASIINCIKIAKLITENPELYNKFIKNKCLPLNNIMNHTKLHRRTVERNRKFIIAIILILKSDLNIIKSYLSYTERAGDR